MKIYQDLSFFFALEYLVAATSVLICYYYFFFDKSMNADPRRQDSSCSHLRCRTNKMGVHKLWSLLDGMGSPITPEQYRGKCVAVDASIWLAQFRSIASSRQKSSEVETVILEGFATRLMKLIFYDIKAVIVFDGKTHPLKLAEVARRRREQQQNELEAVRSKVRRIVNAQISAGVLQLGDESSEKKSLLTKKRNLGSSPKKSKTRSASPVHRAGSTQRGQGKKIKALSPLRAIRHKATGNLHHTRRKRIVVAPETFSGWQTNAFIASSAKLQADRAAGLQRTSSNLLLHGGGPGSSSSLYLGPRSAIGATQQHASKTEPPKQLVQLTEEARPDPRTGSIVIDVDTEVISSCSDIDAQTISSQSSTAVAEDSDGQMSSPMSFAATASMSSSSSSSSDGRFCFSTLSCRHETLLQEDDGEPFDVDEPADDVESGMGGSLKQVDASRPCLPPKASERGGAPSFSRKRSDAIPMELLEVVELLDVFGVPFLFSPGESDGQCAWLCTHGFVDSVLTEDCDLFLHGAPVVVRGFFSPEAAVEYRLRDLGSVGLSRSALICLALLLGCDYTSGVRGFGVRKALEVVAAVVPTQNEGDGTVSGVLNALSSWKRLMQADESTFCSDRFLEECSLAQRELLRDARRSAACGIADEDFPHNFPNSAVAEAFVSPLVDDRPELVHIGVQDWDEVRRFFCGRGLHSLLQKLRSLQAAVTGRKCTGAGKLAFPTVCASEATTADNDEKLNALLAKQPQAVRRQLGLLRFLQSQQLVSRVMISS